jgi:uncharacterized sodium:solute symporter family permease YidK
MRTLDWVVMCGWLVSLVSFGLYRGRGSSTTNKYLLAGRTMPWYAMGLSILATQASAEETTIEANEVKTPAKIHFCCTRRTPRRRR